MTLAPLHRPGRRPELTEAIPPAFSEHIGRALLTAITPAEVAA
ncbi:hypothetical protein [Streptomyces anulatus]|nr:hypothetical protein OHA54_20135 [Streptomyces anulatus]WTE04707.1 hypothetical protein OH765_20235 [Streptomyces anulatus]